MERALELQQNRILCRREEHIITIKPINPRTSLVQKDMAQRAKQSSLCLVFLGLFVFLKMLNAKHLIHKLISKYMQPSIVGP